MAKKLTLRCTICRTWYCPEPQLGERQKTCSKECSQERHRRKCEQWNKANKHLRKGAQLKRRLDQAKREANKTLGKTLAGRSLLTGRRRPARPRPLDIPKQEIQDAIGLEAAVIVEFIVQILDKVFVRRVKRTKPLKSMDYNGKNGQKCIKGARADGR